MIKRIRNVIAAVTMVASMGFAATAYSVPMSDSFGLLTPATFGGTGIPNDNVAITTIQVPTLDTVITLGLSATQRFSNPALTNNGNGTFFAGAGSNFGGAGQSTTEGALWNFDFFINVDSSNPSPFAAFNFSLLYDFDPAINTVDSDLGFLNLDGLFLASNPVEDSQNLLFNFLTLDFPGFIEPPSGSFNPNVAGQYSFVLIASAVGGGELGRSAIDVNVSAVPIPAALPMFGTGLALMGFVGWRRRKGAAA